MFAIEFTHEIPWMRILCFLAMSLALVGWILAIRFYLNRAEKIRREHPPTTQELIDSMRPWRQ